MNELNECAVPRLPRNGQRRSGECRHSVAAPLLRRWCSAGLTVVTIRVVVLSKTEFIVTTLSIGVFGHPEPGFQRDTRLPVRSPRVVVPPDTNRPVRRRMGRTVPALRQNAGGILLQRASFSLSSSPY